MGTRLREKRKEQRYSQEALAKAAGVSRITISNIENENWVPKIKTLEKLAKVLKCRTKDLLS
jgi:DNA-binding XRE family transcriptional regulator